MLMLIKKRAEIQLYWKHSFLEKLAAFLCETSPSFFTLPEWGIEIV